MEGPTTAITTILMHSEQATACREASFGQYRIGFIVMDSELFRDKKQKV